MTSTPPAPLEWHPAYSGHTDLLDWLNDHDGFQDCLIPRLPRAHPLMLAEPGDGMPTDGELRVRRLIRHKAAGLAPYVGDPCVYVWHYAADELGRTIAGEAIRVPL